MLKITLYSRWAQVSGLQGVPDKDLEVHKMVMNIGKRPTVANTPDISIEAHIMHK